MHAERVHRLCIKSWFLRSSTSPQSHNADNNSRVNIQLCSPSPSFILSHLDAEGEEYLLLADATNVQSAIMSIVSVDVVLFLGGLIWCPPQSNCTPNKKVRMLALVSGLFVQQVGVRLATGRRTAKAAAYRGASLYRPCWWERETELGGSHSPILLLNLNENSSLVLFSSLNTAVVWF